MTATAGIEIAKILLTLGAAWWVYFRFVRERSHARRVAFSIECNFFGPQQGQYVAEFLLRIKNQGLVIHRFKTLKLRVRGIAKNTPLQPWQQQPSRLSFPETLIDETNVIFHGKYQYIFVEPGVEQVITFVGTVPEAMSFILARAQFEYSDGRTHSTERVFSPASNQNATSASVPLPASDEAPAAHRAKAS